MRRGERLLQPASQFFGFNLFGGAFGAGLVLVVLPSCALMFGMKFLNRWPTIGLPIMAIFGIMILFGAMALTSTLFMRLGLGNRNEALALPSGSVRAAIALSLIVLFAIIAIMLFRTLAAPVSGSYRLRNLTTQDVSALYANQHIRVLDVREEACSGGAKVATPPSPAASSGQVQPQPPSASVLGTVCVSAEVAPLAGQDSVDLAKQLLVLIGTLMTSVTSFYFATSAATNSARQFAAPPNSRAPVSPQPSPTPISPALGAAGPPFGPQSSSPQQARDNSGATAPARAGASAAAGTVDEEHVEGCAVGAEKAQDTPDDQLPQATGGVS